MATVRFIALIKVSIYLLKVLEEDRELIPRFSTPDLREIDVISRELKHMKKKWSEIYCFMKGTNGIQTVKLFDLFIQ